MVITRNFVAALWGARDESGTIFLYAEHLLPHGEPSQNAKAIKALGDWIPGVINLSLNKGSQAEKSQIAQLYRELGLKVHTSEQGEEAGFFHFTQLVESKKFKVFASLSSFLAIVAIPNRLIVIHN